MATGDRGNRPRKKIQLIELAAILIYAEQTSDVQAHKKFGLARRTIQRHRKAMLEGRAPELARLVEKTKREQFRRVNDLLAQTFEAGLRRIQERLPDADIGEARLVVKELGELMIQRDVLREDEPDAPGIPAEVSGHGTGSYPEGRETEEAERGTQGASPTAAVPAIH